MKKKKRKIKTIDKKRRKIYVKKSFMLYYIIFAILFITVSLILCFTVFFNITEIELTGKTKYKKNEILNACKIKIGDNLILTSSKKAEKKIFNHFKDLDSVEVLKTFPNQLTINCKDAFAMFYCEKKNKQFALVSKNNRVFNSNCQKKPANSFLLLVYDENFENLKTGETFKLKKEQEQKFKIIKDAVESENATNITKINIKQNLTEITFENRVVLLIENLEQTKYLLNLSLTILKNVIGKQEKGKLIYLKAKKAMHFVPAKISN